MRADTKYFKTEYDVGGAQGHTRVTLDLSAFNFRGDGITAPRVEAQILPDKTLKVIHTRASTKEGEIGHVGSYPDFPVHYFPVGKWHQRLSEEASPIQGLLREMRDPKHLRGKRARVHALQHIGDKMHNQFWSWVLPHLDAEALRVSRSIRSSLPLYNLFAREPYLRQMSEQSRFIGLCLWHLMGTDEHLAWEVSELSRYARSGANLKEMLCLSYNAAIRTLRNHPRLAPPTEGPRLNWYAHDTLGLLPVARPLRPEDLSPGVFAWARRAHFFKLYYPYFPTDVLAQIFEQLLKLDLDPNGIHKLRRPPHWNLFYVILNLAPDYLPSYLKNPEAALQAFERYLPPAQRRQGGPKSQQRARILHEIRDMVRVSLRVRENPLGDDRRTEQDFLGGRQPEELSLPRLCELSRIYHRIEREERQELLRAQRARRYGSEEPFPVPPFLGASGPVDRAGKEWVQLVWLPTALDLSEEGAALAHCVGGYDYACRRGDSVIYSLRTREGERIATLELRPQEGYKRAQFYGYHDSLVDPKYHRWVDRMLQRCLDPSQPLLTAEGQPLDSSFRKPAPPRLLAAPAAEAFAAWEDEMAREAFGEEYLALDPVAF